MDFEVLLPKALESGFFAVLFLFSFWFIITEYKRREEAQRELFSDLSESLVKTKESVASVEGKIARIDGSQTNITQDLFEIKVMISSMERMISSRPKTAERE